MEIAQIKYTVGQLVFGKLKGYPPWPAVVTGLVKNRNMAKIIYLNSGQCSELSFKKLTPYGAAKKIIDRHLNKNRGFTRAYQEMELLAAESHEKKIAEDEEKKETKKAEDEDKEERKVIKKSPKVIIKLLTKEEIMVIQKNLKKKKKKNRCY